MSVTHLYTDARGFDALGLYLFNTHDAQIQVEVRASPNDSFDPELVLPASGASTNPFTLAAGDGTKGNMVTEYQLMEAPQMFVRYATQAQSTPTVGDFSLFVHKIV